MTWVKLDDNFPDHPKVDRLSDRAFRLHVAAMCFCGRVNNGGVFTQARAFRLLDDGEHVEHEIYDELVPGGLWDEIDEVNHVFRIHDWEDHNPSPEEVKERRRKAAERQRRYRERHGDASRNASRETGESRVGRDAPPSRPVPTRDDSFVVITAPAVPDQPSGEPSDDDDVIEVVQILARRKLAAQQAAGFAPVAPSRWLQSVSAAERAERGDEALRGALRACDGDAERAVDWLLEPPKPFLRLLEQCDECLGRGVVERDDGLAADCACKTRATG